jgi:hypothetical protein
MRFKNTNDLARYYQGLLNARKTKEFKASLENAGVDTSKMLLADEDDLKEAGEALKEYLQTHMQRYFDSYDTTDIVPRTGQLLDSIQVNVDNLDGQLKARVTFDSAKTIRDSIFQGGEQADVLLNLDKGWKVKKDVWFKNLEHMGFQEGFYFIRSAIEDARDDERFANLTIELSEELQD